MSLVLSRNIEQKDIPLIKQTLKKVFGSEEYANLQRLGGLTNHTYCLERPNEGKYVIRIPGEGTAEVINRADEKVSTELAFELGIDARLLYFDSTGIKVTEYLRDAQTMEERAMQTADRIRKCADVFRILHDSNKNTGVDFDVFQMASTYEAYIYEHKVALFDDYRNRKIQVAQIKNDIEKAGLFRKAPCHNDPLCANWIESKGRMYLIDWEYAGMNDPIWDIAATSIEACYDHDQDRFFLECYLRHSPEMSDFKHLIASKIFVDYLWTLWAKMRVPFDGNAMEEWAEERYQRMIGFIGEYNRLNEDYR